MLHKREDMLKKVFHKQGWGTFFIVYQRKFAHKLMIFDRDMKELSRLKLFLNRDPGQTADILLL